MSYDLMVFEPGVAPVDRAQFMAWYDEQTEWAEPHGYNDPAVTTPRLLAWYYEIKSQFPDINGSAVTDDDLSNPKMSEYCIGNHVIYVAFAWSQAEGAYEAVRRAAEKHGVGFFDVSADEGEIWEPGSTQGKAKKGFWQRLLGR